MRSGPPPPPARRCSATPRRVRPTTRSRPGRARPPGCLPTMCIRRPAAMRPSVPTSSSNCRPSAGSEPTQRIGTPMKTIASLALGSIAILACGAAQAGDNVAKLGLTEYTTHSQTNGISGVGVPPGADAQTGNATTVIFVYERLFTPNIGLELVLGIPPTIKAKTTGSVAFLGDDVLSAKNLAPTLFLTYHFGTPGDTWRPYLGAGMNYTRFL